MVPSGFVKRRVQKIDGFFARPYMVEQRDCGSVSMPSNWTFSEFEVQRNPSSNWASSDIFDESHGGSKTRLIFTLPTPGACFTAFSTQPKNSPATGQPGAVKVMSMSIKAGLLTSMR